MEFPDLFKVLADYVGFVADFVLLRGMSPFSEKSTVDPAVSSYFVAGVIVAYLFATSSRLPGYERHLQGDASARTEPSTGSAEPLKEHGADVTRFMVMSVFAVIVSHGLLLTGNALMGGGELQGIKATMNAVLAWGAVYHPTNAFSRKCSFLLRSANARGTVNDRAAAVLRFAFAILPHVLLVHYVHALAVVHGTGFGFMAGVQGIGMVLLLVLLFVGGALVLKIDETEEDETISAAR